MSYSFKSLLMILIFLLSSMQVLQRIRHPNLVRLYATSIVETDDILVLEYLPEGDVSQHLRNEEKRKRLHPSIRFNIMFKVALELHCLHRGGDGDTEGQERKYLLYHGDIKAANICLDAKFSPKLIDCGLAKNMKRRVMFTHSVSSCSR